MTKVLFGIGDEFVSHEIETGKQESGFHHEPVVKKASGNPVEMDVFNSDLFKRIAGRLQRDGM